MSIRHPTRNGAERRDRVIQLIGAGILLVLIGILVVLVARGEKEKDATADRAQDLATQVREACEAGGETAEKLGSACQQAKEIEATPVVGEQGEQGPPGPPPSAEQVEAAVTAYCSTHTCRGPRGATGPGPSPGDVAKAVAAYCDTRGECRGEKGKQGDPPTAEQLAQAVAAYCDTRNDCRGPAGTDGQDGQDGTDGEDGTDGSDGKDGRGIRSVECRDDGSWLITYTDGTTQTADGPCRARPVGPTP